jgi:DNA-binding response OmpR family regulator
MLPQSETEATVVVCDDDAPTLELLCDHLEADRFRALPAPSAADALRHCHYKQPDLLLLDLNLPDAAGLDVLREIRASEGATGHYDPELPVIVLSGRGTEADRLRGLLCGADDYVVKPFAVQEIVGSISSNRFQVREPISERLKPRAAGGGQV